MARSALSSYSFSSPKGTNIRVYYSERGGKITQTFYDDKSGWYPGPNETIGCTPDLDSGLAIIGWASGNEERLYFIGEDGKIVERCHSGSKSGWYDGELTGKITTANYSHLAVIRYDADSTWCIRVYYQDKDNMIREVCRNGDGAWFDGYTFPSAAIKGTSISCSHVLGATCSHLLYYQKPDSTFVEYISQNSTQWRVGDFYSQLLYAPGAYITCASYSKEGQSHHRVFTIDRDNKLCVTKYDGRSWAQTSQLADALTHTTATATTIPDHISTVRVYLQIAGGQIAEWGTNDGMTYSLMKNPLPLA